MNDFKKEYQFFKKDIDKAVAACLESGWYILGQNVADFEEEFAKFVGTKYCIGVANGLEALQIALMCSEIGEGDEVITVSNTAVATALAISNVGAKPVFVDIDQYHHLDIKKLETSITPKTKAIIPVHLFGQCVDIKAVMKIAKKHNLLVIEDACQAHGASIGGKKAGSFGDFGAFSFYPTKNLGGYGDGGAITTNSYEAYQKCKMLRNYGQITRYEHELKGLNSRLDELQAAILKVKLRKINQLNKKRQTIAVWYKQFLTGIPEIKLPLERPDSQPVYHLFVVRATLRDELQKYLKAQGIETLIHYPKPIHQQDCYQGEYDIKLPETQAAAVEMLSLPIHPFMQKSEVKKVCEAIKRFYQHHTPTVTVAVSAFNEQYNIVPFLISVLDQIKDGFRFEEILIISDGSTDQTPKRINELIKKYQKSGIQNPKLTFFNHQERIGKSTRLNEIFAYLKSDYLVLADADVILEKNVISKIVQTFRLDPKLGLVGGSPMPLPAQTFIEQCVNISFAAYLPIRNNYKNGDSILSATGRIMALKKEVAKRITVPKDTISNDGFTYFSNLSLGYGYKCAKEAIVYFRSPQTLKDQLNQNTRFQATHAFMKRYFPEEMVDREYYIPSSLFLKYTVLQLFRHPIYSIAIFVINRYCQVKAVIDHHKINALWTEISSSKRLNAS